MKKHENAIKAILKKGNMLHGYYEDEAGARYIVNGHVIIKLSGSKLDFIGELPKLYKCGWTDTLNRCIDEAKKGKFEIDININDVKMWDKYGDKIAPYQFIVDKKYMGLSAFYLNKLYTLTDNNIITTTNFKSPLYIAGDDIECVLMPVTLVKGYDENNYNKFITELKACYIQDEEAKKEKATKKANKAAGIIPTLQPNKNYSGFTMSFYGVDYFMLSDAKRITKGVITEFIKAYCKHNNFSDTVLNDMLNSKIQLDNIKARIEEATFILNTNADNSAFTYVDIKTKYAFNGCMYFECDNKLVLIDCVLPTSTETKEETPKTATIQDNAADIVADPDTTNETTAADVMSATNTDTAATTDTALKFFKGISDINNRTTDTMTQNATNNAITSETMQADARQDTIQTETTQDTPHKTSKKAISLFVVTDKPAPVKLYGANIPTLERIPTYTQRIVSRLQPLKSHRVYNTRVSNINALKNDYMTLVDTVSCYNDKCAIGGKVAASNTS